MKCTTNRVAAIAAFCFASLTTPAFAQDPPPAPAPAPAPTPRDVRTELKERMKARYPLLEQLRDAGKVGETREGDAKLVKVSFGTDKADAKDPAKGTVAEVVDAENKDRRQLYELLAKELKLSPAEVGKQNGLRNLEKAKPEHWIEIKGQWVQRKTVRTIDEKQGEKPADKQGGK
jgi:uncharacterized protein